MTEIFQIQKVAMNKGEESVDHKIVIEVVLLQAAVQDLGMMKEEDFIVIYETNYIKKVVIASLIRIGLHVIRKGYEKGYILLIVCESIAQADVIKEIFLLIV